MSSMECRHLHKILGTPRYDFERGVIVSEGRCRFCRAPVVVESPVIDDYRDWAVIPRRPSSLQEGFSLAE